MYVTACRGSSVFHVGVVPQTTRSSCVATTPNDTPRTTSTVPFTSIQPSTLLTGRQASSSDELSRQTADGTSAGRCSTDGQMASDQKHTLCLLPADNFGLFSLLLTSQLTCYDGVYDGNWPFVFNGIL